MPKAQRLFLLVAILWLTVFIPSICCGETAGDTVRVDLRQDWLIYNNRHQTYAPFVENAASSSRSFSFILDKSSANNSNLACCFQGGSSLFIEQEIVAFYKRRKCISFDLDSLFQKYGREDLFVTVYNKSLDFNKFTTLLTAKRTEGNQLANTLIGEISVRDDSVFKNFYLLALLLFLIILSAVYNLNPRNFREFYSLHKAFSLKPRYDNISTLKIFNWSNLLIIFTHCLLISFMLIVVVGLLGEPIPYVRINIEGLGAGIWRWISLAFVVFLLILIKYILIKLLSTMMNLKKFDHIHFFEFIRISIFIYSLALIFAVVLLLAFYLPVANSFIWVVYLIAFLSVVRIVLLYLKFLRLSTFRNLYLFSYLCTTEILPLIIGFKIFVLDF
ncbi:DUF4271 domain-containing protein [Fulvivirgaceae bacterium BMA12]|uniref:DUF4271 domain-containing protein n=1 Tax=Agaribacillus aureus TaxID=3051825 RepID=A0ABT8LFJ9_9BACT|nr:DUF4271 domain-containing protein [Fulvivirgaceae bacterium BMA12]